MRTRSKSQRSMFVLVSHRLVTSRRSNAPHSSLDSRVKHLPKNSCTRSHKPFGARIWIVLPRRNVFHAECRCQANENLANEFTSLISEQQLGSAPL